MKKYVNLTGRILLPFAVGLLIMPRAASGQSAAEALHSGDVLPDISGQTTSGRPIQLSNVVRDKTAVVVFSFSKAAGKDARRWNTLLSKDCPDHALACSTVIMLASAPRLLRGVIVSELNRTMPPSMRDATIVSYQNEDLWKQRLAVSDDSRAYVFLLDASGHIRWRNSGAFGDAEYTALKNKVQEQLHSANQHKSQ